MSSCTSAGKIIYKRPTHFFNWTDVARILRAVDKNAEISPTLRGEIRDLLAQADLIRPDDELIDELDSQLRAAQATIEDLIDENEALLGDLQECQNAAMTAPPEPVDTGGGDFGGGGATRGFGSRDERNRSIPPDRRVVPDLPGENEGDEDAR